MPVPFDEVHPALIVSLLRIHFTTTTTHKHSSSRPVSIFWIDRPIRSQGKRVRGEERAGDARSISSTSISSRSRSSRGAAAVWKDDGAKRRTRKGRWEADAAADAHAAGGGLPAAGVGAGPRGRRTRAGAAHRECVTRLYACLYHPIDWVVA